jgi:hypothetical protein
LVLFKTMVFKGVCTGPDAACNSQKHICNKCNHKKWCARHCRCPENEEEKKHPTILKTPNQPRRAKSRALKDIRSNLFTPTPEALKATPAALIQEDPEVMTLEGLFECFPPQQDMRNLPSEKTRFAENADELIAQANRNVLNNTVNFLLSILERSAMIILPTAVTYIMGVVANKISAKWNKHFSNPTKREKSLETMALSLFAIVTKLPPKTIAARTARAVIVKACSQKNLDENFSEYSPPRYGEKARKNGKADHSRMIADGKAPLVIKRKISRVSDSIVSDMVDFILSPQNVGTLSWGNNEVLIPNTSTTVVLPKLTRKRPVEAMWEHYRHISNSRAEMDFLSVSGTTTRSQSQTQSVENHKQRVGRTTFIESAGKITSDAEKMMQCVDYVTDALLNVVVEMLQRINNDLVAPALKKEISSLLAILRNFLKVQYDQHASIADDKVPSHGIVHGLSLPSATPQETRCDECRGCMFVEWFMRSKLPMVVEEARTPTNTASVDDALLYIADSLDKFHIYQGHRMRVLNQSTYFSFLENEMAQICLSTMLNCIWCIWVIDWKMKFEAQRFREASTHHYGKRGIGWHGVIVVYYTYEAPCEKNKFKARAVRHQVALDQILENGNKQDGFAVLSDMEAAMAQISCEIPHLKRAWVWSDNAGCYHKKELVLGIPLLNVMSSGIKILSIIHTETQDGKGLADGHFSVAFKHVVEYLITRLMNLFRKVCTPAALTDALASKNGLNNSSVQLNYIDREKQEQLETMLSSISAQASEYFARANEYIFNPDADDAAEWAQLDLSKVENWATICFEIRVRAYSRIGSGARFQVNFEEGSFTHIPDESDTPGVVSTGGPAEPTVPSSFADLNDEESVHEEEEDDDDYIVNEFSIEDIEDPNDSDDEEEMEETSDEPEEGDEGSDKEERVYGKPEYKPTVTGVLVSKRLTFGVIRGKEEAMERILKQAAEKDDDQNPERSVVARAIAMASESMSSETSTIRDGKADMPEYDLAKGYTLPDAAWQRDQGWARPICGVHVFESK